MHNVEHTWEAGDPYSRAAGGEGHVIGARVETCGAELALEDD